MKSFILSTECLQGADYYEDEEMVPDAALVLLTDADLFKFETARQALRGMQVVLPAFSHGAVWSNHATFFPTSQVSVESSVTPEMLDDLGKDNQGVLQLPSDFARSLDFDEFVMGDTQCEEYIFDLSGVRWTALHGRYERLTTATIPWDVLLGETA